MAGRGSARFSTARLSTARVAAAIVLAAAAWAQAPAARADALAAAPAIAWVHADSDPAAVDAAFARARADRRPLFLYWGAVWCPPCNQVKATVFKRADFAARAAYFVPVYIDGDSPGAQKLASRFNVSGYPTMILFSPDGAEITRLPGEVDAQRYMEVLALGLDAGRPAKVALAAALAPARSTASAATAADWRMLAYYSWDTDDQQLVPQDQLRTTLQRLAHACPPQYGELAARLALRALVAAALQPAKAAALSASDRRRGLDQTEALLGDDHLVRDNVDLVAGYPAEVTGLLTTAASDQRTALAALWDRALARLVGDATLSTADRLGAVTARVQLARLLAQPAAAAAAAPAGAPARSLPALPALPAVPAVLIQQVRAEVARADRETTDAYERQSVISAAADALTEAGLIDESDALLEAELTRSHSPYYFMVDLAENARKRGELSTALDWQQKAYAAAQGSATRLQWGARYVRALLELAPRDDSRIDQALAAVIGELEPRPETFYGRNQRTLDKLTSSVLAWNRDHQHDPVVQHARTQLAAVCAALSGSAPEVAACRRVLAPQLAGAAGAHPRSGPA